MKAFSLESSIFTEIVFVQFCFEQELAYTLYIPFVSFKIEKPNCWVAESWKLRVNEAELHKPLQQ